MGNFEQLRQISLFTDLDDDAVRALADRAHMKTFAAGERIISQSDNIQAFFIVQSGRVKIFRSTPEGREQILYLVEKGQPFCFCTAFADRPYPVNVTALEKSLVAKIPAPDMEDLARREPLLLLKIMQTLAGRLLDAMNLVESLALHGTRERVASFLLHAESCFSPKPGDSFTLPVSHRELAKIVGTSPETLSRIIQKFNREQTISASGKTIQILDRNGLSLADS
ncbi:Crp/Fnr family transcriptional regulator [uncultured Pseudodesulfovibrio sp.]|uniref:Crp/Fnr family transcriptional regulator n=1 Tax=uncultured Pseudodesulfovibrio sp. TaxID=2035858 RepID=UPI0029C74E56|nr:Crp/Fnr family transcriptional regulator [uncultured Pseudodesulfovibrio sp.]